MKWRNLLSYKCADEKCGADMRISEYNSSVHTCSVCPFHIGDGKLKDIVGNMSKKQKRCEIRLVSENEEALSNL